MAFADKLNALCVSKGFEKKIIEKVVDNRVFLSFLAVTFFAVLIRFSVKDFVSGDFTGALSPWYLYFKTHGGFSALNGTIGDYNVPYQIIIAAMAYIDIKDLYQFKILSCIFDFLVAVSSGTFVYYIISKNRGTACSFKNALSNLTFVLPYTVVLFLPTVYLNSALWAQCDAIYAAFVVLSLFFLYRERFFFSFVFLGCAFAFKLQTAFILPFFFYMYFREKNFSLLFLLFIPLVDVILSLPSLCMGLPLSTVFNVYVNQTDSYHFIFMNYPSFWGLFAYSDESLLGCNYEYLKPVAVITTIIILLVGLIYVVEKKVNLKSDRNFLSVSIWSVWTCVLFLPSMHERYAFLAEILIVLLLFVTFWTNKKNLLTVFITACVLQLSTCTRYGFFLFRGRIVDFGLVLLIHIGTYLFYSYRIFVKDLNEDTNKVTD